VIRSPRQRLFYLATLPFVVAPIAYATYGPNPQGGRYSWMALGTFAGVTAVLLAARARRPTLFALALVATLGGFLASIATAFLVAGPDWARAREPMLAGLWFSASWAISYVLGIASRLTPGESMPHAPDA
jgi:hypothetical protein